MYSMPDTLSVGPYTARGCRRLLPAPINPLGPPGRSTSLGAHQPSPVAQCCMATMPHALLASHQLVKPAGSAATLYCLGLSTPEQHWNSPAFTAWQ